MTAAHSDPPRPDLSDVQGEILRPYDLAVGVHLFLTFGDPLQGRAFLRSQIRKITTAADWDRPERERPTLTTNLGFTYSGLAALALAEGELSTFPYVFRVGMACRAPVLGDTGASAPARWTAPYGSREVHAWLMVQARNAGERDGRVASIERRAAECGVAVAHREMTANFTGEHARAKEHFGFMDGIGQPAIEGGPGPVYPGQGTPLHHYPWWGKIKLGSFLLGYPNAYGETPPFPSDPVLRKNGTYMAFRKLEQHVTRFRDYIEANKYLVGGDPELLAAKMVGRWRSGAPLETCAEDDWKVARNPYENNDFRYADDEDGMNVPHLAHIRRMNPRDSLPPDSVVEPRRHRIIRRSMPYGPWLPEGEPERGVPRGLIFRAFNADLLDQFEMVQSQWVASANEAGGLSTDQDVIAGLTEPEGAGEQLLQSTMRIPRPDGIKTLYGLPRFVTLKGGDYFFVPGRSALEMIATEPTEGGSEPGS